MADAGGKAEKQLKEITECTICMSPFTDPRMLPCIHTFCLECLERIADTAQKKPGQRMPCPLCRKEFTIPEDGARGVQKNFFMENLLEFQTALQIGSATIICDMCNVRNEGKTGQIPKATMKCLECRDNYCDSCVKVHQFQKVSKDHQMVNIGSDMKSEMKRIVSMKSCTKHIHKPLDYYCADCKKIVCVSCFVESHKLHNCKDVTTVDEEFRHTIEEKAWKISTYANEMLLIRANKEKRKTDFMKAIVVREKEILTRNQELQDMIDRHTNSLLDELSLIKSKHLKEMETGMEEIDRCCTIFKSFEAYCTELRLKGSASDIFSSVDELLKRADELERDHEAFIGRPHQSVKVSFQATDLKEVLKNANSNFVGNVEAAKTETTTLLENSAVVVGLNIVTNITSDFYKINLHWPNEISTQEQIPTEMQNEVFAAVYCNTMYVTGLGAKNDEILKYKQISGWTKCASFIQGRLRHSAAFIDEILYVCGGFADSNENVLDTVEAYNAITDKCSTVGKLLHYVQNSGNCVPFKSLLYIFGGTDADYESVSHVQVYSTKENTCTLISRPMPRPCNLMRAVLWETSVTLLGWDTCFVFNLETETWQEREQFKTDVIHFGLVLENGRVFVIGGGTLEADEDCKITWTCRDDIRNVPLQNILDDKPVEWKIRGKLPKPCFVHACIKMRFPV